MPTYDYQCDACGQRFEFFQRMSDAPLNTCPEFYTEMKRLLGSRGIAVRTSEIVERVADDGHVSAVQVGTRPALTSPPIAYPLANPAGVAISQTQEVIPRGRKDC